MPIVCGLILIPIVFLIARASISVKISKKQAMLLNFSLVLIAALYIYIFVFLTQLVPFDFGITYSKEYMFYSGEYWINVLIAYTFSPFMWIITVHFSRMIFRSLRVKKNTFIKNKNEFKYYRDDLDKIAPSIILFASELDVDIRRSISAGILKLKLSGHVKEADENYICTKKSQDELLSSEKMLLELIKSDIFDKTAYCIALEKEALAGKYIVHNNNGAFLKLCRLLITLCIPFVLFASSIYLDTYCFENYHVAPYKISEGVNDVIIIVKREEDIKHLWNESKGEYTKQVGADAFQYSVVRKAYMIRVAGLLSMGVAILSIFVTLYSVTAQIKYFKKNYRRTIKGNILLNKAYGLKNYLKDYSLIKERSEKELRLWQYYLVYAVVLEVNESIEDEVLKKLLNKTII